MTPEDDFKWNSHEREGGAGRPFSEVCPGGQSGGRMLFASVRDGAPSPGPLDWRPSTEGRPFPRSICPFPGSLCSTGAPGRLQPLLGNEDATFLGEWSLWATLHPQLPLRHGLAEAGGSAHSGESWSSGVASEPEDTAGPRTPPSPCPPTPHPSPRTSAA